MIYLIHHDRSICEQVLRNLQSSEMDAEGFDSLSDFHAALNRALPDLILLDVLLSETDGLSVLKALRSSQRTKRIPIILLSGETAEFDSLLALNIGTEAPFDAMDFAAHIRTALCHKEICSQKVLRCGSLTLDPVQHTVLADGKTVSLRQKEFELLKLLLALRGTILNRAQLLDRIWGYSFNGETRTVDVHIRTLRQKLGACGSLIETVRGYGYRIRAEESDSDKSETPSVL